MRILYAFLVAVGTVVPPAPAAEFAIRDGDTVAFLGDSITAAREYGKVIECYTLLRFPERKVRFFNAGQGGDTAKGGLARLDADVLDRGATLVTVAYGVNDIGWGTKADEAHRHEYLESIGALVDRCKARGVRVAICSAAITAEDPDTAEKGFLQTMCDAGLAIATERGAIAVDVQRSMRRAQRRILAANASERDPKKHVRMHAEDGVHLNDLGQMAMAFAILQGLGAPADVSSATVDATSGTVAAAVGCRISDVVRLDRELAFTRSDERLPLNLHALWMLHGFWIPIGDELNRYLLGVRGLPQGRYEVVAGGRLLGVWGADALSRGINIASATPDPWQPGGPWDAQGHAVKILTAMRDELELARRGMDRDLTSHPDLESLRGRARAIEEDIVALQRETARPVPVRFVVREHAEDPSRESDR